MTTGPTHLERRRLRAPEEDGTALVDPPFEQVEGLLRANLGRRREYRHDLQGRCLSEVANESRRQLIADAKRWTSQYRQVDSHPFDPSAPIFIAGHQPQLFHPGVWFKNFALGALAREHGALAINLLIDSDVARTPNVRVPGGTVREPHLAEVPLDKAGSPVPYEERGIVDREVFSGFGSRAAERIAGLVADPLVRRFWPMAVRRMRQTGNLGASLAQARHQLEGRWGLSTLEVPQSWVCQTEPHAWFVAHLLAQLPRLRTIYNEVVDEYRRVNRIRSKAHPVPNLGQAAGWLEAPFWIWTAADPQRRRLFARHNRHEIVLSDRVGREIALPLSPDGEAGRAVERLMELDREGVRIRSRALITTLWARLVLGDLFLHGIGGAKYDRLTDALVERFFGLEPPDFLVLSATLHLPVARARTTVEDLRAIEHRLRRLTYHPECFINGTCDVAAGAGDKVAELIAAKARWIRAAPAPELAPVRYREIRRINEALEPCVAPLREWLLGERSETERSLRAEAVLSGREYAFCLFPEKTLRKFLLSLLPKSVRIGFDNP